MLGGKFVSRLDWYIFRQLAAALVAVTVGLTALIWLTQSLRFVKLVVDHGLSFGVFLELTALLVPSFVAVILPITTFVVVQFVYQRLAGDRELTVMRAAGLSPISPWRGRRWLWRCWRPLAGYALNLWIVPASLTALPAISSGRSATASPRFCCRTGFSPRFPTGSRSISAPATPDGMLHGILVDDARDPAAETTVLARAGRLVDGPHGPEVLLLDGSRQQIDARRPAGWTC